MNTDDWDEDEPEVRDNSDFTSLEFRIDESDEGVRLDRFVVDRADNLSRNHVQRLIELGHVRVDGKTRRQSFKLAPRELVSLSIPPPTIESLEPEAIPLDIMYEDRDLIVLNKPAGMVVHPAPGNPHGTLVNALLHHAPEINVSGSSRPGIIHRLDKDTSGLMVVAKTDRARESLLAQWQARTVRKNYIALVRGAAEDDEATIDMPIARDALDRKRMAVSATGRAAITHFRTNQRFHSASLFEVELETGRTHQIRVHLNYIGHPIVGDAVYNRHKDKFGGVDSISPRQFLHASVLAFSLPDGRPMTFRVELPPDLRGVLRYIEDDC